MLPSTQSTEENLHQGLSNVDVKSKWIRKVGLPVESVKLLAISFSFQFVDNFYKVLTLLVMTRMSDFNRHYYTSFIGETGFWGMMRMIMMMMTMVSF